jgi:hypothetical protein
MVIRKTTQPPKLKFSRTYIQVLIIKKTLQELYIFLSKQLLKVSPRISEGPCASFIQKCIRATCFIRNISQFYYMLAHDYFCLLASIL